MNNLNKQTKIIFTGAIISLLFIIGIIFITIDNKKVNEQFETYIIEENNEKVKEETAKIKVHVTGEIAENGIIELEEGSRISDVIEKAGGSTEDADLNRINLAYVVEDGQKIYIPSVNDEAEIEYITEESGDGVIINNNNTKQKININTATQTELESLSGIGPSTALKIINYRKQNGKFTSIEDIQNVSGIGEAKYEAIKDEICVK